MASFGNISEFNSDVEPWAQYIARLQQFFVANDIVQPERQRAIFLTVVGPQTYSLLTNLLSPDVPTQRTLPQLLDVLTAYFEPPPSEIVERFKFNSRVRKPGESVCEFIAELRRLAKYCSYGTTLDMMLRDRLVCGIQDEAIQKKLLSETALTLTRASEIAIAMETATRNASDLKSSQVTDVLAVKQKQFSASQRQRNSSNSFKVSRKPLCYRCGESSHISSSCRFITAKCNACGKIGHIAKICQSTKKKRNSGFPSRDSSSTKVKNVVEANESTGKECTESTLLHVYAVHTVTAAPPPIKAEFFIHGNRIPMEIDSGAPFSLVPMCTYHKFKNSLPKLESSDVRLQSFTKHPIEVAGRLNVQVEYKSTKKLLPLLVVKQGASSLAGRDWINAFSLLSDPSPPLVQSLASSVDPEAPGDSVISRYPELFSPGLGRIQGIKVHLSLRPEASPKFCKARPVPYAMLPKIDQELNRLVSQGILEPVKFSAWATPIVPVLKQDGSIRICGDFKLTVNPATEIEQYPLPNIEDMFSTLSSGSSFSKIDLRDAYCQLELDEESKNLVVINTHRGLFRYTRLPFGVASAPAIFQREIDKILQGLKGASCYLDDLLVTGTDEKDHLQNINLVLSRLQSVGAKLHPSKCVFMQPAVEYLGHRIDKTGLHPVESKIDAIIKAPIPTNVSELRSFIGLVTYYAKFLPNMSTMLAPLYKLLKNDQPWKWQSEQSHAFSEAKEALTSSSVLIHFDHKKEVILACDASPYGVGAVLSHPTPEGDRPIAFASRSLTKAEKNYSHLEKEALALIFGVLRFRKYLLGKQFTLLTDHQPLVSLFSESKPVPTVAAARIQRWALTLAAYTYKIKYSKGISHANAGACSRLPIPIALSEPSEPADLVLLMEALDDTPITIHAIRRELEASPHFCQIVKYIQEGWPKSVKPELQPWFHCRYELSVEQGVILRGCRVFVPPKFRPYILNELHSGHQGMTILKALARSSVWWPGIDSDIENLVRNCTSCQLQAPMPPSKHITPWPFTSETWDRIHIDHAGPFENQMLLVVIDAGSKWMEVIPVSSTSSTVTISVLMSLFCRFGLPRTVVSDNGTSFTSNEFASFMKVNGITHIRTAPYHPQSNGLAERAVRTVKTAMKKISDSSFKDRLQRFLFAYRRAPFMGTGIPPAVAMYGRPLRSKLDLIHPDPKASPSDCEFPSALFQQGDPVWYRNFDEGPKWCQGTVECHIGKVMLSIRTPFGHVMRHFDQVRKSTPIIFSDIPPAPAFSPEPEPVLPPEQPNAISPPVNDTPSSLTPQVLPSSQTSESRNSDSAATQASSSTTPIPLRRSSRVRHPPDRLQY